jgi:Flp pilus assembly protein TadD
MRVCRGLGSFGALAGLVLLCGCETSSKISDLFGSKSEDAAATASVNEPAATASVEGAHASSGPPNASGLLGSDPYDDLNEAKRFYRTANYGLAERYYRRAVEARPKDAEAWLGLAASYDQLKRFDLADRAYNQTIALVGPIPEVLNNKGYSYILRGDYGRARTILLEAEAKDPANPYIQSNLGLLNKASRRRKGVQEK